MTDVFKIDDLNFLNEIKSQAKQVTEMICNEASLCKGDIFVVGCSSSEVIGEKIGTHSSLDVANALFEGIYPVLKERGIYLAVQCCEHLNRALILEKEAIKKYNLDEVCVVPKAKAGGSLAAVTFEKLCCGAVENIRANAGLDIGLTMIGMHLKDVAVPVRLEINKIGNAPIVCAKTRPKFIGGERAKYN